MSVNLKICTWNIDGLDEANIEDRVVSICSMLVSLDPDGSNSHAIQIYGLHEYGE